jgi:hypothetical protein
MLERATSVSKNTAPTAVDAQRTSGLMLTAELNSTRYNA